jgi:YgiT-type zinc finger domain-containing protein
MEHRLAKQKKTPLTCRTCGGIMDDRTTDLPFKTGESSIVIIKDLPVSQCSECHEYVLADSVMSEVERILASVDKSTELEIVRFAA